MSDTVSDFERFVTEDYQNHVKEQAIRRFWFYRLSDDEQDEIIKPHFEGANLSDEARVKAADEFDDYFHKILPTIEQNI